MIKTLYGKTIAIFLIVMMLSFTFSGILMYGFFDDYFYNANLMQLEHAMSQLSIFLEDIAMDPALITDLSSLLNSYINSFLASDMYIFVLDRSQKIIMSAPNIDFKDYVPFDRELVKKEKKLPTSMPDEIESKIYVDKNSYYIKDEYADKIKAAITSVTNDYRGDFFGLYDGTGLSWLTLTKKLQFKNYFGYDYSYSIIISKPEITVYDTRNEVIKFFASSVAVSTVLAMIVVSFYTRMITMPLKQLKESARKVARGDFSDEIVARSNDEIGELIKSYNTMVKDLKRLDKVKSDFIANVSHDLRTPLTSINGFISGMLDGTIPDEKKDYYLKIVRDEVQRLTNLVNSLLEITRIDNANHNLNLITFNINELIRTCLAKYENIISEKNLEIEVDFENYDEFVVADKDSIERVFINLLHNAIKFTNPGGKITVGTHKIKNKVEVYVRDTGVGIDEKDLDYIWDRFYKTDKSRGMDKTGTGLGLSICKSIINAHDQDIQVESKLGEGSKFIFTLNGV